MKKVGLLLVLALLVANPLAPWAQERMVTLNFKDVEIAVLVKLISDVTGKNFVLDERVRGKVTIISPTSLTAEEAYQLFLAVLDVKGFAAIPAGKVIKIVPAAVAKQKASEIAVDERKDDRQNFITQVITLKFSDAQALATSLAPLVPPTGSILAHAASNRLIISDIASSVERLIKIIAELDNETLQRKFEVIPLKYASPEEVASAINSLLTAERRVVRRPPTPAIPVRPPTPTVTLEGGFVTPDPRTNSLLVSGTSEQIEDIKKLIAKLDIPLAGERATIHVYYLENAVAEEMAKTLNEAIGKPAPAAAAAPPRAAPPAPTTPTAALPGEAVGQIRIEGVVNIVADKATNSLIITATPSDYERLKEVIKKLDMRRRQVYVEAMIMELTMDRSRELGVELQNVVDLAGRGAFVIGRTAFGTLFPTASPTSLLGLVVAAFSGQTVTLPDGRVIPARQALIRAIQTDSQINLISTPQLLTMDNEESEILVGSNIPIPAGVLFDPARPELVRTQVERKDIGVIMRIKPQITEGDFLRLNLYQELSQAVPCPAAIEAIQGLCVSKRTAKSAVVVKDSQMVVIGGLIEDRATETATKVPLLGDIPILGHLFKTSAKTKTKDNLVIFLVPRIVRSEVEMEEIKRKKEEKFQEGLK